MKFTSLNRFVFDMFGMGKGSAKKRMTANLEAYRRSFLSEYGEVVLADLMRFAEMDKIAFNKESNAEQMIFLEGKRAMIHYIFSIIELTEIEFLERKKLEKGAKENGG